MGKLVIAVGAIEVVRAANSFANAGGLFGEGGLIRGDVGRIMKPVQERVFTPIVRGTVTGVTTTVGTAVGTYYGGPWGGVAGGTAGVATGNWINRCAAGRC